MRKLWCLFKIWPVIHCPRKGKRCCSNIFNPSPCFKIRLLLCVSSTWQIQFFCMAGVRNLHPQLQTSNPSSYGIVSCTIFTFQDCSSKQDVNNSTIAISISTFKSEILQHFIFCATILSQGKRYIRPIKVISFRLLAFLFLTVVSKKKTENWWAIISISKTWGENAKYFPLYTQKSKIIYRCLNKYCLVKKKKKIQYNTPKSLLLQPKLFIQH